MDAMTKRIIRWAAGGFLALLALITALNSFYTTSEGYLYFVQDKAFKTTKVISTPGFYTKTPFMTDVYEYKRVATIDATDLNTDSNFTRKIGPIGVQFADTYTGNVPATFRYRLPQDEVNFRKLHSEFRSFDNLVDTLLVNNSINVATVTATQYTGEEFIQGGVNAYKAQMEDQLRNGLYVTERRQVEVKDVNYAPVSSSNADSKKIEESTRIVMKNVIVTDNKTGQPKRLSNPLAEYGVTVSQVTIGKPTADASLESLLDKKRTSVGAKITAQQDIETNQVKAEAEKQRVEIEKQRAIQLAQKDKELAVIAELREVEVERQRAQKELVQKRKEQEVAVIEKQKELEIAKANEAIQQANSEAASYEAEAIRKVGLAEAEVEVAKLSAKQSAKDIYMAELQRDIANVMYPALKGVVIDMPDFYSGANGFDAPTSLDVFTTLGALKELQSNSAGR